MLAGATPNPGSLSPAKTKALLPVKVLDAVSIDLGSSEAASPYRMSDAPASVTLSDFMARPKAKSVVSVPDVESNRSTAETDAVSMQEDGNWAYHEFQPEVASWMGSYGEGFMPDYSANVLDAVWVPGQEELASDPYGWQGSPDFADPGSPLACPSFAAPDFHEAVASMTLASYLVQSDEACESSPLSPYVDPFVPPTSPGLNSWIGAQSEPISPLRQKPVKLETEIPAGTLLALPSVSVGSALHGSGQCRPCAWFYKPSGCSNGAECLHCHSCPASELKDRRRQKAAAFKSGKRQK